jgi:hypothetical protein
MPARARKTRIVEARAVAGRTGLATAAEVAEYLQRSEQTLANWRWQNKGPKCSGKGRGVLYSWDDVDEWLKGQTPRGEGARRRGAA